MCIIPIRCYSCGKVVGNKWEPYKNMLERGIKSGDALDRMKLKRWCCRRMILAHADLIDDLLEYTLGDKEDKDRGSVVKLER